MTRMHSRLRLVHNRGTEEWAFPRVLQGLVNFLVILIFISMDLKALVDKSFELLRDYKVQNKGLENI